jgi:hypothetical protein
MDYSDIGYEDSVIGRALEKDAADRAERRLNRKNVINALVGKVLKLVGLKDCKKAPRKHLTFPNSLETERLPETSEDDY